ncbi:uncharacterized protein LOC133444393 isoform X2 [Cololabis saira]|nr:uncharacterized protein LOC133444393 isoform X2 [Cololabis saira]XP_061578135.1 uncharacterized protein LOC133444393 isoform X2 [Cololabis saira]
MFEQKNPDFRYRTSLIMNELQNGNLSLRVSNLQLSDKGTYLCKIVRGQQPEVLAKLELDVVADLDEKLGAVSEPKLTVIPDVTGYLTVQCGVEGWLPEPEITFLDDQGNDIHAEKPERTPPNLTRKVRIQTAPNRVTCRVHQQSLNLTRDAEMYIAENCVGWFVKTIIVTVIVTLLVSGLICCLVLKKPVCNGMGQRSPVSHDYSGSCKIQIDDVGNVSLLDEFKTLKSTLEDKEEEIHRLNAKLNNKDNKIHQLAAKLKDKDEEIHQLAAKPNNLITGQNNVFQKDLSADDTRSSVDANASVDLSFQHKPRPAAASTVSQNNLPKDQIHAVPRQNPGVSGLSLDRTNFRTRSVSDPGSKPALRQRSSTMSLMVRNRYQVLEDLGEES